MLTQTDGKGHTTTFEYNVRNKQVKRIEHGGRITENGIYIYDNEKVEYYRYNPDGSMLQKIDRKGQLTTYEYDIHGRLLRQTVEENQISYTYDNKGNQLSITDSTGTTTRVYDELDRVLLKIAPNIGAITYKYDIIQGVEQGHTKEISKNPKENVTEKTYDKVGRLKTVTTNAETTTYSYDGNGNRTSVIYPDGSKEEYTYYTNNLLDTLTNTKADGTIIDTYKYTYDSGNNQITKVDSKGTTYYSYDSLNRLIKVTEPESLGSKTTLYSYDKAGNRTKETTIEGALITKTEYIYNEQNRLIKTITEDQNQSKEETDYTYDANGNMIYKKVDSIKIAEPTDEPSFGMFIIEETETIPLTSTMITRFKYDEFNQMIESSSAGQQATYKYNGEGYRVEKTVNGETTRYLYEYDKVVLEVDDKGNQIAKNTYGTNLISREVEGETAYYFYNGHADVVALMNNTGEILATYYYDAFGNQIEETGTINNPYRYAGYQYDEDTGKSHIGNKLIVYEKNSKQILIESIAFTNDTENIWIHINELSKFEANSLNGEYMDYVDYIIEKANYGEIPLPYAQQVALCIYSIQTLNLLAGINPQYVGVKSGDYEINVISEVNSDYTYPYYIKNYIKQDGSPIHKKFINDNLYYAH